MTWLELLVLALASMFWPTLILIVVLGLRSPQPVRILSGFLVGGLLATVSTGIALTLVLQGSSLFNESAHVTDPVIYITMGAISLLVAVVLHRRSPAAPKQSNPAPSAGSKPSLMTQLVERGAVAAFAVGIVLNILPGTFPIVALKNIAELDASNTAKIATIIVFYLIMFTFVEAPLIGYLFAPDRTRVTVDGLNGWLGQNKRGVLVYVIAGVGVYLIARGVVEIIR